MRSLCPIFGSGFLKGGTSIAIIVPPGLTFKYLLKPFWQFPLIVIVFVMRRSIIIPVNIPPLNRTAVDSCHPPQTVIGHGPDVARAGEYVVQAAVFTVVGVPLGISRTAQLPALPRQLVILIVPLAGAQYRVAVFNLLAVDQAAKGVIGTQIGNCAARSFAFASLRAAF